MVWVWCLHGELNLSTSTILPTQKDECPNRVRRGISTRLDLAWANLREAKFTAHEFIRGQLSLGATALGATAHGTTALGTTALANITCWIAAVAIRG